MGAFEVRLLLFMVLVFLSRIPFLDTGYGSEEDAWGVYLTAEYIALNSTYEYSRLPGHPVPELFYATIWKSGAYIFNIITAFVSSLGIASFVITLKRIGIRHHFLAGLILAFTPVIYINSTNSMDYTWALAFSSISWFLITDRRFFLAGIAIGIAAGCRITSLAVILPLLFFIYDPQNPLQSFKNAFYYLLAAMLAALFVFSPLIVTYGLGFFTFYQHWPYPEFAKSLYKFTLAPFGVIGFIDLCAGILIAAIVAARKPFVLLNYRTSYVLLACFTGIAIFTSSFWILPFKAAFVVPILPFLILLLSIYLREVYMKALCFSMMLSCFFVGLNLNEPNRSATPSAAAFSFEIKGHPVMLDLLQGPLMEDISKRRNRMRYAEQLIQEISKIEPPAVIITGYWYNFILGQMSSLDKKSNLHLEYYIDEEKLTSYKNSGFDIFCLDDQIELNDLRYRGKFTRDYVSVLKPEHLSLH